MVEVSFLRECFEYDAETGIVSWGRRPRHHFFSLGAQRTWNTKHAGREAGRKNAQGYKNVTLRVDGHCHKLYAHRIGWTLAHGTPPVHQIDHINNDRSDNRIANLRDVTHIENMMNRVWRPALRAHQRRSV